MEIEKGQEGDGYSRESKGLSQQDLSLRIQSGLCSSLVLCSLLVLRDLEQIVELIQNVFFLG